MRIAVSNKIYKIVKTSSIPNLGDASDFISVSISNSEISVVCEEKVIIKNKLQVEKDWRLLTIKGPLDFSLIGVISSISSLLASQKISIFVVSTFDTDYFLVKNSDLKNTVAILLKNNYQII